MSNDWFGSSDNFQSTGGDSSFGMDEFGGNGGYTPPTSYKKGGWHVMLTILALVFAVGASFLMAYLTQGYAKRSALLLGLTFAVVAFAVMAAAILVEAASASMVPRYSRKGQIGVALVCVLCCFIVGCFGQTVDGFIQVTPTPIPTATPSPTPTASPTPTIAPTPTPKPMAMNYVIAIDKSNSMNWNDPSSESIKAVEQFMRGLPDTIYMGVVAFEDTIPAQSAIAPLSQNKRAENSRVAGIPASGTTDFVAALSASLDMVERGNLPTGSQTLVLLVTDAEDDIDSVELSKLKQRCDKNNVRVSCLIIANRLSSNMTSLVNATGGQVFEVKDVSKIHQDLMVAAKAQATPSPTPYATPTPVLTAAPTPIPTPIPTPEVRDVVRDAGTVQTGDGDHMNVMSMVMMILEGLFIGISLMLMTSRQGQRRFQPILSTLMGIAAGLILNYLHLGEIWLQEAIAFSCYGVVFMTKNK